MILPDNGKVVIIDNKIDDVQELMAALSKEKVPFVYYQNESGEDLPAEPIENVRLIFLDLKLIDDTEGQPAAKVISPIVGRLKRILKPDNGPYVLIYWSNREDEYRAIFEKEFEGTLKNYKPLLFLSLDKKHSGSIADIKKKMEEVFKDFGALNAFLFWESLVNKSGGDVVNDFSGFVLPDKTHDQSLKNIIFKLAEGVDEQGAAAAGDEEKMKKAFSAVNSVLLDALYSNCENGAWPNVAGIIKADPPGDKIHLARINTRLHLKILTVERDKSSLMSGNIYAVDISEALKSCVAEMIKRNTGATIASPTYVLLDVSPPCDYAQGKVTNIRLLPGILFEDSQDATTLKSSDSGYCNCPSYSIDGKVCKVFFDFRYLESQPLEQFRARNLKAKYRLGMELVADIQAKLARHVNRPGIISIK